MTRAWTVGLVVVVVAFLAAGCCCFGSGLLPPRRPDEATSRAIASRYLHENQALLAGDSDAGVPGCHELSDTVLADASSYVTSGYVGGDEAVRVAYGITACVLAVVIVLVAGVWTAVGATASSEDGSEHAVGLALEFSEYRTDDGDHDHHHDEWF